MGYFNRNIKKNVGRSYKYDLVASSIEKWRFGEWIRRYDNQDLGEYNRNIKKNVARS